MRSGASDAAAFALAPIPASISAYTAPTLCAERFFGKTGCTLGVVRESLSVLPWEELGKAFLAFLAPTARTDKRYLPLALPSPFPPCLAVFKDGRTYFCKLFRDLRIEIYHKRRFILARPTKQGLDYFPLDVGFFGDKNIRILKARYRSDGIAVYIKLLCDIYKEGYFLPVECWEDYIFVIADEIGATPDKVEQIITFLHNRAMVRLYRKDELTGYALDAVITSHGIQKRYATAIKSRRKKGVDEIKRGFWLLTEDEEKEINAFYKCGINGGFSTNNPDKTENNPVFPEINPIKESKSKIISTDVPRAKADFFEHFPNLQDTHGVDDSRIDYVRLLDCFNKSKKFLQTRRVFSWVVEHYDEITVGKYDDLPEAQPSEKTTPTLPPAVQSANARADRERFYADRKNKAQAKADEYLEKAMRSPIFKQAEQELKRLEIEKAKAELYAPEKLPDIHAEQARLREQREKALADLGLTSCDLLPKWHCAKCSDTGFLPNGTACNCYNVAK